MNTFAFGAYVPGRTVVHRLDARAKLIFTACLMMLILTLDRAVSHLFLLAFVLFAIRSCGFSWGAWFRSARPVLLFIAGASLFHLFVTSGGKVLLAAGPLEIHEAGLRQGLLTAGRLFLLTASASLLTATTSPAALTDALERLLSPLSRLGLPIHELAMMMSIALRFIPVLWEEAERIRLAQSARGADFESGFVSAVRAWVTVFVPLLVSTLRRADELSLAMEARGYRGGTGRTRWRRPRWSAQDNLLFLLFAGLWVLAWMLERMNG
ncbi:energy-coupling factor transporter transmembrane component T family protein [Staphylospora marina]|uniref:energy-coupling factor transporter transmembrane component T family protein n=1 Tax=Staphylospora marina TaxID=2490858 RepID=UPI000F5BC6C6|nr:energy-coupling factor transporter transmembrane component T [Staphylospora marina]